MESKSSKQRDPLLEELDTHAMIHDFVNLYKEMSKIEKMLVEILDTIERNHGIKKGE